MSTMTTSLAKTLLKGYLDGENLKYEKLTAQMVDSVYEGVEKTALVTVHGWVAGPAWFDVSAFAQKNGFIAQE